MIYGIVDASFLSAFPALIARELMQRDLPRARRRVSYGALTLVLVMIITATYHAGYKDLQNVRGIVHPEIGNAIVSVPVNCIRQSCRVRARARVNAFGSGDARLRKQRSFATTCVCRLGQRDATAMRRAVRRGTLTAGNMITGRVGTGGASD